MRVIRLSPWSAGSPGVGYSLLSRRFLYTVYAWYPGIPCSGYPVSCSLFLCSCTCILWSCVLVILVSWYSVFFRVSCIVVICLPWYRGFGVRYRYGRYRYQISVYVYMAYKYWFCIHVYTGQLAADYDILFVNNILFAISKLYIETEWKCLLLTTSASTSDDVRRITCQ